FFSTSAGFNEAVVLFSIEGVPGDENRVRPPREPNEGALIQETIRRVNASKSATCGANYCFEAIFYIRY
ncbi:MAG: hypothetical protein KKD26_03265, partial [Alphaproteobacteria bacterium]|nr:hypothetical protein [Alphaproteobacteria bacterium]